LAFGALILGVLALEVARLSVGDSIDATPVRRRFLPDIVEAYGVDILIDYRAASADQFGGISEVIAVMGV
jgi:hypothetical protein